MVKNGRLVLFIFFMLVFGGVMYFKKEMDKCFIVYFVWIKCYFYCFCVFCFFGVNLLISWVGVVFFGVVYFGGNYIGDFVEKVCFVLKVVRGKGGYCCCLFYFFCGINFMEMEFM